MVMRGSTSLKMERCRLSVDSNIGHVPTGPHQLGAQLERFGDANRFDGHVGAEAVGEPLNDGECVLVPVVDGHIGTEPLGGFETASARSIATTWPGEKRWAPRMADKPIGPAPTTATVSPGCTLPLSTPTS